MALFIKYNKYKSAENMLFDEALINFSIQSKLGAVLRLYGWESPAVTIGRNQNTDNINFDYCTSNSIDIIKRPTGGRAIYHNDELTYSFICPVDFLKNGNSVINSYKEISDALAEGFKILGITLEYPEYKKVSCQGGYCMSLSTGSDLGYNNKKFIGSAQLRKNGYILQHGSIPFKIDFDKINKIFFEPTDFSKITTLNEINSNIEINTLCESLKAGFEQKFNLNLS
jgi:lipoyl(octanoyl) transferase